MNILTVGPLSQYATIAAAMLDAQTGDLIVLEETYANELVIVTVDGLTFSGGSINSTGITLKLGAGVTNVNLDGDAPLNVLSNELGNGLTGNDGDNVVTVSEGIDTVDGGAGDDRLIVNYSASTGETSGTSDTSFTGAGIGSVNITGGFEHFTILAGTGVNQITTGAGDDIIIAEDGVAASTIVAGEGDNKVLTGAGIDTINVGSGNDTIIAGDGASTIVATGGKNFILTGNGVDTILVGGGADIIQAGDGANTITGLGGDKTIITGIGIDTITLTDGNNKIVTGDGASTVVATDGNNMICGGDGIDTVTLGDGDNIIHGGGAANTLTAGDGANFIYSGSGVDTVAVGNGGNYISAGDGANTLTSGSGNDTVLSGVDIDTITTGAGDDQILIMGAADVITAGAGTDTLVADYSAAPGAVIHTLSAGDATSGYDGSISGIAGTAGFKGVENFDITSASGADSITTGGGDDTIDSGTGDDTVNAGAGSDYIYGNGGDIIDGGEGGTDNDTLNLYGTGDYNIVPSVLNPESGVIVFLDSGGSPTGEIISYSNIENIVNEPPLAPTITVVEPDPALCDPFVPCFTSGAMVLTERGTQAVETLRKGDFIMTRDSGFKAIIWIGIQEISGLTLAVNNALQPISIRRGALSKGCPNCDMMVSPQHRMLQSGLQAELLFGTNEVLVKAKHLVSLPGVSAMSATAVTYVHFMFDQHEIVFADGAWSESFQPGERALSGNGGGQYRELAAIFPELSAGNRFEHYDAARLSLKSNEARKYLAASKYETMSGLAHEVHVEQTSFH